MSSYITDLYSAAASIFNAFNDFMEPFVEIAKGASQLIGMFV